MTMCTHLGYEKGVRSGSNVTNHLKDHILTYTSRNFRVTEVHCDNDSNIKSAHRALAEVHTVLKPHAAGDKCNKVERKIQNIKATVRSLTSSI